MGSPETLGQLIARESIRLSLSPKKRAAYQAIADAGDTGITINGVNDVLREHQLSKINTHNLLYNSLPHPSFAVSNQEYSNPTFFLTHLGDRFLVPVLDIANRFFTQHPEVAIDPLVGSRLVSTKNLLDVFMQGSLPTEQIRRMPRQRIEQIKLLIKDGYLTHGGKIGLSDIGTLVYNELLQAANHTLTKQNVDTVTRTLYAEEYSMPVRRSVAIPA